MREEEREVNISLLYESSSIYALCFVPRACLKREYKLRRYPRCNELLHYEDGPV